MSSSKTDWTALLLRDLKFAERNPDKVITFYVTDESIADLCQTALYALALENEAAMRINVEIATIH
jgi:hypothetical protein|tara:strand:- start:3407 stop:3604 length:198 start_codon:yes stop_codon:yes gene_type:complete